MNSTYQPDKAYSNRLVEKIWNLKWSDHFPRSMTEELQITYVDYRQGQSFAQQYFPQIYHLDSSESQFQETDETGMKDAYYEAIGDFFLFRKTDGSPVGMAVGTLLDWSSYNFRNIAILPEYQASGLYWEFVKNLAEILKKHGVQKIEGDISPTNRRHIHIVNKIGFISTSLQLSERWGALLHFVLYLDEALEDKFGRLFSSTYASDSKNKKSHSKYKHINKRR
ncbi:MAG: GNAT family N-acetyltransferase [Pseudomonadales bacterium]|nr:GNAT family N-acetyltransferase [Pseudomonadales bacterium]